MATPIFDFDKTIQSALYVAERIKIKDFHRIFKILYFADRGHLSEYGRTITGETYIKKDFGPVPSNLFNIFKSLRKKGDVFFNGINMKEYFTVHGEYFIKPEKKPDLYYLSKSDVSELNKSISKYGKMLFGTLSAISHDIAWQYAKNDKELSIENILREVGEDEEYIAYISDFMNTQKAFQKAYS